MSSNIPDDPKYWGRVRDPLVKDDGYPPNSTLVDAFGQKVDRATDAIVLRGYSGTSTIVERAREFLTIAKNNGVKAADIKTVNDLLDPLDKHADDIQRIYLTPRLDRYVDFHKTCLLAWRYEAKSDRQDAVTVWLRAYYDGARVPIPYRVIQETMLGPSSSAYLGGDLVDDYLGQPGTQDTAWGNQAGPYKSTTRRCGE